MMNELKQTTIHLSGGIIIPDLMPECLKILEVVSKPVITRYLVKEKGIVIQGLIENTINYIYQCPLEHVEKSKRLKSKINFARYIEIIDLKRYATINLKVYLEWKKFSLINPRNIHFYQIIGVNPTCTLNSKN